MPPSSVAIAPTPVSPSYSSKNGGAIKPNPHPYAIKTTSSGLLTRSNSTTQNQASRHFYVPPSPTQNKSPEMKPRRGLRPSRSLSRIDDDPRPLPNPPGHKGTGSTDSGFVSDNDWTGTMRRKPTDTFSSMPSADFVPVKPEDLPSNPKVWTPSQLASYLTTALRVRSGEALALPQAVTRDIAVFVKESKINGRVFLRLSENDLEGMGVNKPWQRALLAASRNLRQNVLKGRIWGAEDENHPFSTEMYNTSSSSIDSVELPVDKNADDEPETRSRRVRRYRNGRVRGMVESLERSGSFSSDGSFHETGIDIDAANAHVDEEAVSNSPIELVLPTASRGASPTNQPLPAPPVHSRDFSEEPTMEELLKAEEESKKGTWGAKAWVENDLNPGVTVKKMPTKTYEFDDGMATIGSGGSGGSNKSKDDKKAVTSIFNPSQEDSEPQKPSTSDAETIEKLQRREGELLQELKSSNELLEAFRRRLEEVEAKVGVMQQAESQLQVEVEQKKEENQELKEKLLEQQQALVRAPTPAPSQEEKDNKVRRRNPFHELDPQTMSALSQYVLLVGLGVCAVVLRVVLKKVLGRKLSS